MSSRRAPCLMMIFAGATWVSCSGVIENGRPGEPDPTPSPTAREDRMGSREAEMPIPPPGEQSTASSPPGASYSGIPSLLRRLSRDELIATFEVLTGVSPARDDLPADEREEHGTLLTTGVALVGPELGKLKQVIGEFTTRIAPTMLDKAGCAHTQQAQRDCLGRWASAFAELALRRPLDATESAKLQGLFEIAGESKDLDTVAVRGLLNAVFFTPSFLYRPEIGTPLAGTPALRELGGYEIAARLSYLATLGPPDAELLAAAREGRLKDPAERGRQLTRLAGTDRGRRAMTTFVLEWMGANESKIRDKSAKYLAGLDDAFEKNIRASAESAIRAIVSDAGSSTLNALLTAKSYLDDAAVQTITKAAGSASSATGDTSETGRTGLLMHPFVLSAHTKEDGSSPFLIGAFIRQALLCEPVPEPPPDAAAMARTDPPAGLSMREDLEYRTNALPLCASCHALFSPLGYSFLPFDPVGRWTRQDPSGKPWNLSGEVKTRSGIDLLFTSPGDLTQKLGAHPQVQDCLASGAGHWAFGRGFVQEDQHLLGALSEVAARTRASVPALFKSIVESRQFTQTIAQR
jgi:hypothetical protein